MSSRPVPPIVVGGMTESDDQHWVTCESCSARWAGPYEHRLSADYVAAEMNSDPFYRAAGQIRNQLCCVTRSDGSFRPTEPLVVHVRPDLLPRLPAPVILQPWQKSLQPLPRGKAESAFLWSMAIAETPLIMIRALVDSFWLTAGALALGAAIVAGWFSIPALRLAPSVLADAATTPALLWALLTVVVLFGAAVAIAGYFTSQAKRADEPAADMDAWDDAVAQQGLTTAPPLGSVVPTDQGVRP